MKLEQFSDRPVPQSVTSLKLARWAGFAVAVVTAAAFGCSAGAADADGGPDGGSDSDGSGAGGSNNTDLGADLGSDLGSTGGSGGDCVKLATWGALGTYGAVPGMDGQDAITTWLNEYSTGEAEYFAKKPAITAEALASYQIIILQNLNGWTFSADEKAAFEAWIRAGGGVVSLAGYSDQPTEAAPTNDLLAFSGLSYVGLSGAGDISTSPKEACSYCLGNSDAQGGWEPAHPISANITAVGALWGRSVSADAGETVATWDGKRAGATVDVDAGRVFLFHDEWVTYNSQWNGASLAQDCRTSGDQACMSAHPTLSYQIPQFWYNTIKWLAHEPSCFDIRDMTIVK